MDAIIFDLDGTLWDVTKSTYDSANNIALKFGLKAISKEIICKGFGTNKEESAKLYFPDLPLEESVKIMDEISNHNINNLMRNGGNVYPNVKEVLTMLKEKYNLYIVSNTSRMSYIEAFLNCSNTKELFNDYIAASGQNLLKYEAIQKIVIDNKIQNAVYVGDTFRDKDAAKKANIGFIHAKYGFDNMLEAKYSISCIEELPKLMEKIGTKI